MERMISGALKQPPSLSVRFPPGLHLDLQPIAGRARPVGSFAALAHHAFKPVPFGHDLLANNCSPFIIRKAAPELTHMSFGVARTR